ncbi:MAG: hypothetical protein WBD31_10785 [Rubripirellula sp.]
MFPPVKRILLASCSARGATKSAKAVANDARTRTLKPGYEVVVFRSVQPFRRGLFLTGVYHIFVGGRVEFLCGQLCVERTFESEFGSLNFSVWLEQFPTLAVNEKPTFAPRRHFSFCPVIPQPLALMLAVASSWDSQTTGKPQTCDDGHMDDKDEFASEMAPLIQGDKVAWEETITKGLENASDAFIRLFDGDNLGKAVVRISDD